MKPFMLGLLLLSIQFCVSQRINLPQGVDLTVSVPNFDKVLEDKQANIYWLGEAHGTKANYDIAYKYFRYLVQNVGIDYFIIEDSRLSEILLNKYLTSGNEKFLNQAFDNYQGTFAYSKDNHTFFKKIYTLYSSLPKEKKFRFVSIDIEHNLRASHEYISNYVKQNKEGVRLLMKLDVDRNNPKTRTGSMERYYYSLLKYIQENKKRFQEIHINVEELEYLVKNFLKKLKAHSIKSKHWNRIRDSLMYENFKARDKEFDFASHRSFAFFGTDHCYKMKNKKEVNWIAALIQSNRTDIKQNSTIMLYSKSEFMLPKGFINPTLFRSFFKKINDHFYVERFRNNDNLIAKHKDIKYLKKNEVGNSTMWNINTMNSQWDFVSKKIDGKTTKEYFDNLILVKFSNHCNPYKAE